MIGQVTTVLGEAGVNISDMGVGRSPANEAALMVMATDALVPADVLRTVIAKPGCSRPGRSTWADPAAGVQV
jgi:D-3-phosphoglycerate dehydrogenase